MLPRLWGQENRDEKWAYLFLFSHCLHTHILLSRLSVWSLCSRNPAPSPPGSAEVLSRQVSWKRICVFPKNSPATYVQVQLCYLGEVASGLLFTTPSLSSCLPRGSFQGPQVLRSLLWITVWDKWLSRGQNADLVCVPMKGFSGRKGHLHVIHQPREVPFCESRQCILCVSWDSGCLSIWVHITLPCFTVTPGYAPLVGPLGCNKNLHVLTLPRVLLAAQSWASRLSLSLCSPPRHVVQPSPLTFTLLRHRSDTKPSCPSQL